jgi:hypothetical protein
MHSGVTRFVRWIEAHKGELTLNPPSTGADLSMLEQQLGTPLPDDLRQVLTRFNGGILPSGQLLPAGTGPGTIEAAMRQLATLMKVDILHPELPLPFHRTTEGSVLAFDRGGGPVADTWPIIDYYEDTGDTRLVYRTFDGWCRTCVAEWESPDFGAEFSLEKYLRQGERHAVLEPDVSTAHATVAHAQRRVGNPDAALEAYLRAARCIPPLPWCDWEALKLAVLLHKPREALEAATRLSSRAPSTKWRERETSPTQVADVIGRIAMRARDPNAWSHLLDQLDEQAGNALDRAHIHAVRKAVLQGQSLPKTNRARDGSAPAPMDDLDAWWKNAQEAYREGSLREDDILLDPALEPLRRRFDMRELLRIRREF